MEEIDSAGVRGVAERIGSGTISVRAAANCASDFVEDGLTKAPFDIENQKMALEFV